MLKPTKKSPKIEALLNKMGRDLFGLNRAEALALGCCINCKEKLNFKTMSTVDYNEFCISGLGPCCFPK